MDFAGQPDDLLIEQAKYLPVETLLNLCRTDQRFSHLCDDPRLWRAKIAYDFPGTNLGLIQNPRQAYLQEIRDPRSIYFINAENQVELINSRELIPDELLFDRVRQIAESIGRPYNIFYSRPVHRLDGPDLEILAIQDEKGFWYRQRKEGVDPRITQVDIVEGTSPSVDRVLKDMSFINLPSLRHADEVSFTLPTGERQTLTYRQVFNMKRQADRTISNLKDELLKHHRSSNSPLVEKDNRVYQNRLQAALNTPLMPIISTSQSSLQERKNRLIDKAQSFHYPETTTTVLGFRSKEDFSNFQEEYINRMSEEEIQLLETFSELLSRTIIFNEEYQRGARINGILFDAAGRFIIVDPY